MKGIGKILLIIFSVLAIIGLVWVSFTPGAVADTVAEDWMTNIVTDYLLYVSIIALVITVVAFAIYKVVDLLKHPSHLREAMWVGGAVLIAAVIGFVFSGSEDIIYGNGEVYKGGTNSKLIGTGIIATLVLLVVAFAFLAWDTIKGIIKG